MKPLSLDTPPEIQRIQFELLRRLPPSRRLCLALELTELARNMMLAGLRTRFPAASEEEIRRRFIARILSREDVTRVYGFDPQAEGY